jgi:hypothetical protein
VIHMGAWIQDHRVLLGWLGGISLLTFLGTLIVVPWLVVRIPSDYFIPRRRQRLQQHTLVQFILIAAKNILGYVFLIAGALMLVLPGQGLMTLFIGITLLDLPGKYRVERRIASYRPVLHSINWLRQRSGRAPLIMKEHASQAADAGTGKP